jgi:hypothetical protein
LGQQSSRGVTVGRAGVLQHSWFGAAAAEPPQRLNARATTADRAALLRPQLQSTPARCSGGGASARGR